MIITDSDLPEYRRSLLSDIREYATTGRPKSNSYAAKVSNAVGKLNPQLSQGPGTFLVPVEGLRPTKSTRSLTTLTGATGHFLTEPELSDIEKAVFPFAATVAAGAKVIDNLSGDYTFRRHQTEVSVEWLGQTDQVVGGDGSFTSVNLTPHRASTFVRYTRQLLHQVVPDLGEFEVSELARAFAAAQDFVLLQGNGRFAALGHS